MIIRQAIIRHGRRVVASRSSSLCIRIQQRPYAIPTDADTETNSVYGVRTSTPHKQQTNRRPKDVPIVGHPDNLSTPLDTIDGAPTPTTREIESLLESAGTQHNSLEGQINALIAAQNAGLIPVDRTPADQSENPEQEEDEFANTPFASSSALAEARAAKRALTSAGSTLSNIYRPAQIEYAPPSPEELTLELLLANQTHLGHATQLWHPGNSSYIHGIRHGIHIISLDTTLSYLRRAAKVVREVARRGGIILFVGTRKGFQNIVVNSAKLASPAYHVFSRWIPGSLTNGQQILESAAIKVVDLQDRELSQYKDSLANSQRAVMRPDLVICLNPIENEVCLHECGLYNVPTIGIVDTDCNPAWVTYPVPANDDSLRSVALISGALARAGQEGQEMRREAARRGEATFDTRATQKFLRGMEELSAGDVQRVSASGDRERSGRGGARGRRGAETD